MFRIELPLRARLTGLASAGVLSCAVAVPVMLHIAGVRKPAPFSTIQSVAGPRVEIGAPAPDISWHDGASGNTVRLSDFRGKPVVLYQGSYTCPPFRVAAGMIEQIARQYKGRVHSFFVYSREAHSFMGTAEYMRHPVTLNDRQRAARDLIRESGLTMPVLIDGLNNRMEKVCGNIPSRILVLDAQGKVAYLSGDPTSSMAFSVPGVLDRLLGTDDAPTNVAKKILPPGTE